MRWRIGADVRGCQAHILTALRREMEHRGDGLAWVGSEREAVATAANEWAVAHGARTVTVADVERVEAVACGQVDYASKLALFVTELILGQDNRSSEN